MTYVRIILVVGVILLFSCDSTPRGGPASSRSPTGKSHSNHLDQNLVDEDFLISRLFSAAQSGSAVLFSYAATNPTAFSLGLYDLKSGQSKKISDPRISNVLPFVFELSNGFGLMSKITAGTSGRMDVLDFQGNYLATKHLTTFDGWREGFSVDMSFSTGKDTAFVSVTTLDGGVHYLEVDFQKETVFPMWTTTKEELRGFFWTYHHNSYFLVEKATGKIEIVENRDFSSPKTFLKGQDIELRKPKAFDRTGNETAKLRLDLPFSSFEKLYIRKVKSVDSYGEPLDTPYSVCLVLDEKGNETESDFFPLGEYEGKRMVYFYKEKTLHIFPVNN